MVNVGEILLSLWNKSGFAALSAGFMDGGWQNLVMIAIACVLLYLGIVKQFEPLLLLPIAFGMLLTNLLGSEVFHEELFAGGHVNWCLFGGATMVDGANILTEGFRWIVDGAGNVINADNALQRQLWWDAS